MDFAQQIFPGTFEYALNHIVNHRLDLRPFDAMYDNEHKGAEAYSPAIMLKIILFCYAHGILSSRRMAKACETNITLMALSGDTQPHFTSIATFVASMHTQIAPLFTRDDFHFNRQALSCVCPAGNVLWITSKKPHTNLDKRYYTFQGYLKHCRVCPLQTQCMRKPPKARGRQVSFPSGEKPSKQSTLIQQMKDKIDSKAGREQYSKRLGCVEPVFANITKNKKMDYFTLRGKTKVNAQWQMYCMV